MGYSEKILKDTTLITREAHLYGEGVTVLSHVEDDGTIMIDYIKVPPQLRRKGIGSQILEEFKTVSEGHGVPIKLQPSTDFGTPPAALFTFYVNNGFFFQNEFFWYNRS